MSKRVVITGVGAVTPLGNDVKTFWDGISKGKNGIGRITRFDPSEQKATMGAEVKDFEYPDQRAARRMDLFCQFGMHAAKEAIEMSGLVSGENIRPEKISVIAGSGIGGIMTLEDEIRKAEKKGIKRVSPMLVPMVIGNILAGNIAIEFNAKGNCVDIVTACATGTHAIGEGMYHIMCGRADAVIAGGAEAPFGPACFSGFANMTALSTRTEPDRCSTPFDKERDGFVMGEGAGIVILESLDHALERGAKIYGEIAGYGTSCDAYHITSPAPDGGGAAQAMREALRTAEIKPDEVSYINAHGTGTPYNDLFETRAIKDVFGEFAKTVPVSSTKSMTGHLLGAAGAIEAIVCLKAIEDGIIPPTINIKVPDEELDLDYVPDVARHVDLKYAMSNSLGFGGHNGTVIFKKYEE